MRLPSSIRFTLLALAIAFVSDRGIAWFLDGAYESDLRGQTGGQINLYLQRTAPPDVLVMGSSRAHHGIDPALIDPDCYNLSHNGMNVAFQAGLVDILAGRKMLPRHLLLLQLQPEDLACGAAVMRHLQFLKYHHGSAPYITSTIDGLNWSERLKYLSAGYRFNGSALTIPLNAWRSEQNSDRGNGFEPRPAQPNDSDRVVLSIIQQRTTDSTLFKEIPADPMSTAGGDALGHIKALCDAAGVTLLLFTAPYFECTPIRREAYDRIGRAIRAAGYEWIDYSCEGPQELRHLRYWVDNDHVNAAGAQKLTRRLAFDLRRLGLLGWSHTPR